MLLTNSRCFYFYFENKHFAIELSLISIKFYPTHFIHSLTHPFIHSGVHKNELISCIYRLEHFMFILTVILRYFITKHKMMRRTNRFVVLSYRNKIVELMLLRCWGDLRN